MDLVFTGVALCCPLGPTCCWCSCAMQHCPPAALPTREALALTLPCLPTLPLALQCIKYCLENRFGFKAPGCIVVLTDDQKHPDFTSTRANIMRGIHWLLMDQRPGDSLFFHFSGHGSQQADYSGDELDGWVTGQGAGPQGRRLGAVCA